LKTHQHPVRVVHDSYVAKYFKSFLIHAYNLITIQKSSYHSIYRIQDYFKPV